jgi:predicted NAD/FAD-binding protein
VFSCGSLKVCPNILFAQANNPPPQDVSFTVTGKITERSQGKITVDSGQNMLFNVEYNSQTKIQRQDGSSANVSDLKVGVKVRAEGVLTEAGDIIAKKIVIQASAKGSEK